MTYARWVVVLAVMVGCGDNWPAKPDASQETPDAGRTPVARGRYIMNTLGACTFCHTPVLPDGTRDNTRLFAGVDCFLDIDAAAGSGCLSTRNLTNDATGLKNVTDQQIKDAFTKGKRTDGKTLSPVMPYYIFHNMSEDDQDAIVAYLRTVPAVSHTVAPNEPPWSFINDSNAAVCDMLGTGEAVPCVADDIDPATIPQPSAGFPAMASALRGRYLSSMVGLCMDCHTPELPHVPVNNPIPPFFPRPIDMTRAYTGGRPFQKIDLGLIDPSYPPIIFTRNLTPDATGLMGFTLNDVENAIARGKDREGKAVCAATHGSLISPYAALDDVDLEDISNYVLSLGPVANNTGDNCQGPLVP